MADKVFKIQANLDASDPELELVWAGRADTLTPLNIGEGLANVDVTVMGQPITKLTLKAATATTLGGVKINGNGLVLDGSTNVLKLKLGTGLAFGTNGEINVTGGGSTFNGSADDVTETTGRVFVSPQQRTKLDGIEASANNYTHPTYHDVTILRETEELKVMTKGERQKLLGIEEGANKYIHPENHPASIITETTDRMFVSSSEKQLIARIPTIGDGIINYVHPDSHPASMIIEDDARQFVTKALETKLSILGGGTGRFSGANARDTVTGETVATYISNEIIVSDSNQYDIFRTANKGIISGTVAFSKDNILIPAAGYSVDYTNGVIDLVVPGSSGTYKVSYVYSATGKIQTHYAPVVSGTVKLYKDGVLVPSTSYTVDYTTGIVTPTVSLGAGNFTVDYTHTQGTVINHNKNITMEYHVMITPTGPTGGTLGEYWVDKKEPNRFIVRNTGSNESTTFDWFVVTH